MKVRLPVRPAVALVLGLVAFGATPAWAQMARTRTPPGPNTPRTMVQVFGSVDKVVGPQASDELREEMISSYPSRTLWVIDRKDIISVLEQSGYPTDEQLPPSDEAQLAKAQRADDYIRGRVVRDGVNLRVEAAIVLTRDPSLVQPLPVAVGNRPDRAVKPLGKAIDDARRQLPHEKACMNALRDRKFDEALKAADAGVAAYPQATLVRYCKMAVLSAKEGVSAKEQLAIAGEILAIDSTSKRALEVAADASQKSNDIDQASGYLLRLLEINPGDAARYIDALASYGKLDAAKAAVVKSVAENPGDTDLVESQIKILTRTGDLKAAITASEELVQMDSTRGTAVFYSRLVALYAADSQPVKAKEAAARATTRHPQDSELWQVYAQQLRRVGEGRQSIVAARRALEIDPKIPNAWTGIAASYMGLNEADSAFAALRSAKSSGVDSAQVANFALQFGNRVYRSASAEEPKRLESFRRALPFLLLADSLAADAQSRGTANVLIGTVYYSLMQVLNAGLSVSRSCDEARAAKNYSVDAALYAQKGGRANPSAAGQILNGVNQVTGDLDKNISALCKR